MEERERTRWEKYPDAIRRANRAYEKKFIQTKFLCEPELRKKIDAYCSDHGLSLAEFMRDAIERKLNEG